MRRPPPFGIYAATLRAAPVSTNSAAMVSGPKSWPFGQPIPRKKTRT